MKALVSSLYFLVFSLATRVISIGVSLVVESNSFIFFKIDLIGTFVDNTRSLPRPAAIDSVAFKGCFNFNSS